MAVNKIIGYIPDVFILIGDFHGFLLPVFQDLLSVLFCFVCYCRRSVSVSSFLLVHVGNLYSLCKTAFMILQFYVISVRE